MNNITTLKSTRTKCESPKTPGGISKSLLTPCRRVGLSRKWRNAGPSPFISPLTTENSPKPEIVTDKKPTRKKARVINTDIDEEAASQTTPKACGEEKLNSRDETSLECSPTVSEIVSTPTRSVQIPRKSNSKVSIMTTRSIEEIPEKSTEVDTERKSTKEALLTEDSNAIKVPEKTEEKNEDFVTKPARNKSVRKTKTFLSKNTDPSEQNSKVTSEVVIEPCIEKETESVPKKLNSKLATKLKSPNNLTKECMVVIQRKINRNALKNKNIEVSDRKSSEDTRNTVSQALFDSDSDEAPLSTITKKQGNENVPIEPKKRPREVMEDEDEDFHQHTKVKKLIEKNTSTSDLKINKKTLEIVPKPPPKTVTTQAMVHTDRLSSQDSYDDDEDFDFGSKRTILIRKTYDKTAKLQKAKSTGSITLRDIEDLKNRIEIKKKQLLAKTMTQDTEELRNLIRRWKKGCQDALVELMDLMKSKCPDKCMDYSEILRMLKIPSGLVGYDADNDTFVSPEDASIILSKFNV